MWQNGTNISEERGTAILRKELSYIQKMDAAGMNVSEESAVGSSEVVVSFYQNTWNHVPEDCNLHIHFCQNLKSLEFENI